VLTKLDMLPDEKDRAKRVKDFLKRMKWKGPVFEISALARKGLEPLTRAIYEHVAVAKVVVEEAPDPRFAPMQDAAP
jgi:GTPase